MMLVSFAGTKSKEFVFGLDKTCIRQQTSACVSCTTARPAPLSLWLSKEASFGLAVIAVANEFKQLTKSSMPYRPKSW